jgi:hypothetical protein
VGEGYENHTVKSDILLYMRESIKQNKNFIWDFSFSRCEYEHEILLEYNAV